MCNFFKKLYKRALSLSGPASSSIVYTTTTSNSLHILKTALLACFLPPTTLREALIQPSTSQLSTCALNFSAGAGMENSGMFFDWAGDEIKW